MSGENIAALPASAPWGTRATRLAELCAISVRRHWLAWIVMLGGFLYFTQYYMLAVNLTPSLPYSVFIIEKSAPVTRNDFVAFRWHGGDELQEGLTFVKIVKGITGDKVTRVGRSFYVNTEPVGVAKLFSLTGKPLEAGREGVIGNGEYYVMGTHKDSLDSRYALTGWVKESEIVGRAYAIF